MPEIRKPRAPRTNDNVRVVSAGTKTKVTELPPLESTGTANKSAGATPSAKPAAPPAPRPASQPSPPAKALLPAVKPVSPTAKPVAPPAPVRKPRNDPSGKEPDAINKPSTRPVVSMDTRQLSKAQMKKMEPWHGSDRGSLVDSFFAARQQQAQKQFGTSAVMIADPKNNTMVCIPVPSLAFEYVICQDGFPLGLVFHLNGQKLTGKSALLYEFFRWFVLAGGGGELEEVETKFSQDLFLGVTRLPLGQSRVSMNRCISVEDWQQRALFHMKPESLMKRAMIGTKEEPGPGRTIPMLFGVDSIMGKLTQETQENIQSKGHGGRAHPIEALAITGFMKTIPQLLDGWPFSLVLLNHLKFGTDDAGREEARTGGGDTVGFQESFELRTGVRKSKIHCLEWEGAVYSLKCVKNSFGPTNRSIDTRMLWWDEQQPDGSYLQRHAWDWHWSTVKMFYDIKKNGGAMAAKLSKVLHIDMPTISDVENTAFSKTLGMKDQFDRRLWPEGITRPEDPKIPVSWSELGQVISMNEPLMDELRQALGIFKRPRLKGDYGSQVQELKSKLR